jgi:F0F1-type ATP synthase membrane subunit b/b'
MASIELIPKFPVLIVQTGVFLASFVVVKKLLAEPYLAVKERRQRLTGGNKEEAVELLRKADALSQRVNDRLLDAAAKAKKERDDARAVALEKRQGQLSAAEAEARAHVDSVSREIAKDVEAEKAKIPSIVASLTQEVYKAALA